jgi:H+-transporting ATPase
MGNNESEKYNVKEILERQSTNSETGLSSAEAKSRIDKYGTNEIPDKEETTLKRILKRLWGPIPWMIETAAILSAVVRKWEDFTIIIVLLCVNVIVDFLQEAKALSALKVLKDSLAKKTLVKRDGKYQDIDSKWIVPGDIIKLKIGTIVPADAVLVSGNYLQVDQAALTGESLPVNKKSGELVYDNSIVKMGEMEAVVTETGMNTFFGKSASLVIQAGKQMKSHFQRAVMKIGNGLISLTAFLAIVIIIVSVIRQDPIMDVIRFVLVLAVASIPVALPAVMSVTLAVGAINLAKKQAIVSRLAAIEELAGVDILCSDKTGTLTQNKMSIGDSKEYNNFTEKDLFSYAVLSSSKENKDPIEIPIFAKAIELGLEQTISTFSQEKFVPFDPVRKRTDSTVKNEEGTIEISKGAPQVILSLCMNEPKIKEIKEDVYGYAAKGNRTLGVAIKKDGEKTYTMVGLIPMYDPPREDSKDTIAEARKLGIKVKMITGDNHAIATEIARMLDIGDNIIDAGEIREDSSRKEYKLLAEVIGLALYKKLSPDVNDTDIKKFGNELIKDLEEKFSSVNFPQGHIHKHESEIIAIIENADGFSQVLPEDKYFIIDKLQRADNIVAMTGDGVNDAPALKKADAGIAVSGATDAARAAADLVLLAPGLSVIINALTESRLVFERMKSYATFRIAETLRVILFMSLSILVFNFYPVTAIMIIILALLNDIPIMMIAYDNAEASKVPVRWNMREVMTVSAVLGTAGVISSFLLYYFLVKMHYPQAFIQTLIFVKLDVAGHSTIYVTRSGDKHFWKKPYPSLKFFVPAFSTRIIGTLIAIFGIFMTPVSWQDIGYIWIYATVWFIFNDYIKVWTYKLLRRS